MQCSSCGSWFFAGRKDPDVEWFRRWSKRDRRRLEKAERDLRETSEKVDAMMDALLAERGMTDPGARARLIRRAFHRESADE
jgi:hypothetical protein